MQPGGQARCWPILLLRRVPMMRALRPLMRPLRTCTDAFLTGGFGPIGEGALFYATLAERHTGFEEAWTVGGLVVFGSVIRLRRHRPAADEVVRELRGPEARQWIAARWRIAAERRSA